MKMLSLRAVVCVVPLLVFSSVHAAVDPSIVPADSMWLIYADLNSLRTSILGKELVTLAEQMKLDTGQGQLGLDMQKVLATVGSITAYGANFSQDPKSIDGALVAQGTPDLRKIIESVLIQANLAHPNDVIEITDLPFPAYAIRPPQKDGDKLELIVAFPPEPVVIASKSRAQVVKARDAFRHAAPSVATTASAPLKDLLRASRDGYLFSACVTPADAQFGADQPQTRILKMTKSGAISVSEKDANTFAHAELIAASDQMADKLMKILQGMTAMMSLAETNDRQLSDFLNSAKVARNGNTVTLELAYASDRIVQMIKVLNDNGPAVRTREERIATQPLQLINGRALAQWQAKPVEGAKESAVAWRTIENVSLNNGALISLGRFANGGKNARFDRIEIVPADGNGAPLVFRTEFMRMGGPRNNLSQFQFPGSDGTYTFKVAYLNDPDGKALYAVSVRDAARAQQSDAK
jgi:hypothetical protein